MRENELLWGAFFALNLSSHVLPGGQKALHFLEAIFIILRRESIIETALFQPEPATMQVIFSSDPVRVYKSIIHELNDLGIVQSVHHSSKLDAI